MNENWGPWQDRTPLLKFHPQYRDVREPMLEAWCNQVLSVQESILQTKWGVVIHLWIRRHDGQPVTWAEMQRVKDERKGPERVGVQVFPAASELVDEAPMYHLWILPEGYKLPFSLKRREVSE